MEEKAKVAAVGRDESDDAIAPKLLAYALLRDSERNGWKLFALLTNIEKYKLHAPPAQSPLVWT